MTIEVEPEELRDLASRLDAPLPEVEASLEQRVDEARQRHEAAVGAYEQAQLAHQRQAERQAQAQRDYESRWAAYQREQEEYTAQRAAYDAAVAAAEKEHVRRAAEADRSRRTSGFVIAGGGLALAVGVVLVVLGQVVPGVIVAGAGLLLAIMGLLLRGRSVTSPAAAMPSATPPSAPIPPEAVRLEPLDPPTRPELDPEILRLEAEISARRAAISAAREQRTAAERRLSELGLAADAAEVRRVARAKEDSTAAAARLGQHKAKAEELERARRDAARSLADVLGAANVEVDNESGRSALVASYDRYVDACSARAKQATEAARRPGLEQAYKQRLDIEETHGRTVADWQRRERNVIELARELDDSADEKPDAAGWLRRWLTEQQDRRSAAAKRNERRAALRQLLDGRTLEELELELAGARPNGPEPAEIPNDLDAQVARLQERRERLLGRGGDLRGQQTQLMADTPSVAQALEGETNAEASLAVVRELADGLELATAELERAKERSHATVAPALEACTRPWIPEVTRGRYLDIRINPGDLTMKVTDQFGAVRDAHLLSHGTTEQLYLLLRVALAQHLASVDETAPLILDDVTVQSDAARTRAILDLLHRVSQERQVVLFSQEDEVAEWARERFTDDQDMLTTLPDPVA